LYEVKSLTKTVQQQFTVCKDIGVILKSETLFIPKYIFLFAKWEHSISYVYHFVRFGLGTYNYLIKACFTFQKFLASVGMCDTVL